MHAFNGYNSCLFAYGQTGSGKTYTMMGGDPGSVSGVDAGVIPRLCLEIFEKRARIEGKGHSRWKVTVGYVEVYNERVSDLLARRRKGSREDVFVDVREHPTMGVFIEGQRLQEVSSVEEVVELIELGNRVRHTASTKMNDRSSRSHAIFMLILHEERSTQTASGQVITTAGMSSRMNLVDLAGSERVAQSEVVGQQFNEARYINLSLTTLGRVIDMLADMAKNKSSQWSTPPYRESKLTYILKDSLGGNSKTFMIATVSPSALNYEETLSTLRYASRARDIVNMTRVNEDPRARRIRELEEQMEQMRQDIKGKDPTYVRELEEKLVLLEAEAQKRAADLHALEKEREKNIIREKMLYATEVEREELLIKATELERQVEESKRRAEYHEEMSQRLKDEYAQREQELLEKVRQHRAEIEGIRERKDAEMLSSQQQLSRVMSELEQERHSREEALHILRERQEQLSAALCNSQQSSEKHTELQQQNEELSHRMQKLLEECEAQQRILSDLEVFRLERNELEEIAQFLDLKLEETEHRHIKTINHLLTTIGMHTLWQAELLTAVGTEVEIQLTKCNQHHFDQRAAMEKNHKLFQMEQHQMTKKLEQKILMLEKEIEEAKKQLDTTKQSEAAITNKARQAEDARAAVERNLETVEAERNELQQRLDVFERECAVLNIRLSYLRRKLLSGFVVGEEPYKLTRKIINIGK